jgi:hypothetical protein
VVDRLGLIAAEDVSEARHAVLRAGSAKHDIEKGGVRCRHHVPQIHHPATRRRTVAQRAFLAVETLAERHLLGGAGQWRRRAQLGHDHRGRRQRRQLGGAAKLEHEQARLTEEQTGVL